MLINYCPNCGENEEEYFRQPTIERNFWFYCHSCGVNLHICVNIHDAS